MNAVEIEQAVSELAEQPFDAAEFPYAFLMAFGNKDTTIKRLRTGASNKSDLGGVLQTNNIHLATCAPGDIAATLTALRDSPATTRAKAKFILATDGIDLEAEDITTGETETITNEQGRTDARLRVIFDNGTESNMLMRSLQRALNKDDAGRRITDPSAGPLFSDQTIDGDEASGIIYVLRSKSDHPLVTENRELVHKIGVTNMSVEKRIAGAHLQPTFLMGNVEVVAIYELYNINRSKLENLIHRIFEPARLEIEIMDRFGRPVVPREWFLVPLFVINDAVEKIRDGTITSYRYDPHAAELKRISG